MTIQQNIVKEVPVLPDTAPFSADQRAWLNGFFAGLLSLDDARTLAVAPGDLGTGATQAITGDGDDGEDPWHDPALPMAERMELAEGRPLRRRVYAAMAQQDCGQCGYLCEAYAEALIAGEEPRQNLCVPGGKETSRMLKRLFEDIEDAPIAQDFGEAIENNGTPAGLVGFSRDAPATARFLSADSITGDDSARDTRHVVFDLAGTELSYEPGDSFGVYVSNDLDLVDSVLSAIDAPADFPINNKPLRQCLIEDFDLGLAPDMLFELAGYMVGGSRRKKVKALAKGDDPDGDAETFDVLKTVEVFGPMRPDPEAFLECLEPLQPRLYSISSSPRATPSELHLTVDAVRFEVDERKRLGVASTFLADRIARNDTARVYIQKAHDFALPEDPTKPIIMIGPGTGIAPFRSFLWHRKAMEVSGRSWLFFGHQHEATEFFYRTEMEAFLKDGTLTRLSTAWSRDGAEKVYVQDRLRESGADVWQWLADGAHLYVCGDAQRMAKDVDQALHDIVGQSGQKTEVDAKRYIADLKAAKRYQTDVY